jgi:hypothetical protein
MLLSEQFVQWLGRVPEQPGAMYWMALEGLCLATGLAGYLWIALQWVVDQRRIRHFAAAAAMGGLDLDDLANGQGPLAQAVELVRARSAGGLNTSHEHLIGIVEERYALPQRLSAFARSTATMVGLLFTFIGLSLALFQLQGAIGDAMAGSSGDVVAQVLGQIRDVLPSLSLAFASSIAGVIVVLVLSIIGALVDGCSEGVAISLTRVVARWVDPLVGANGGVEGLAAALRELTKQQHEDRLALTLSVQALRRALEDNANTSTRLSAENTKLEASLQATAQSLTVLPTALSAAIDGSLGDTAKRLSESSATFADMSKRAGDALQQGAALAAAKLVSAGGDAGEALKGAADDAAATLSTGGNASAAALERGGREAGRLLGESSVEAAGQIGAALDDGMGALTQSITEATRRWAELGQSSAHQAEALRATMGQLEVLSARVAQELSGVSSNLTVSATHIEGLARASERFVVGMDSVETLVDESHHEQSHILRQVRDTLESIRPMTEQVAQVSLAAERAATVMHDAFASEAIAAYIQALPLLTDTLDAHRLSAAEQARAARALATMGDGVEKLDHHVRSFGASVQTYQRLYEEVATATTTLSQSKLPHLIGTIVQQASLAESAALRDSIERSAAQQERQLSQAMQRIAQTLDRIDQSQQRLNQWATQPGWRRLFGASSDR